MLSTLTLTRFRGFQRYSVTFGKSTFLVGPNNAGKSTILTGLRLVEAQLRIAMARRPTLYAQVGDVSMQALPIALDTFQALEESIRYDFGDRESRLRAAWKNGTYFNAIWPEVPSNPTDSRDPFFYLDYKNGGQPRNVADVKKNYQLLGVVPPLGPVDTREPVLSEKYIRERMGSRLSSRHFRNQLLLLQQAGRLDDFFEFANGWTPDLKLVDLRTATEDGTIDLYYEEGARRHQREIAWAGDGMQVWWQILHHVFRNDMLPTIILDEPEVFLHPDLQRRLVRLLESTDKQVVVATHSSELLAEVDPRNIALIDRAVRSARKIKENSALSNVADQLGSRFNLALSKALRSRAVLFVEGRDVKLLRVAARVAGFPLIDREHGLAIVEMDGFSPHDHVEAFDWLCKDYLASAVRPYVLLDRDYKSDVELAAVRERFSRLGVPVHIWAKKELESYFLKAPLIARVAGRTEAEAGTLLNSAAEEHKVLVSTQLATHRMEAEASGKLDKATILERANAAFEVDWGDVAFRVGRGPAKDILAGVNRMLQAQGNKAVSFPALAAALNADEVDTEMLAVLSEVSDLFA